jgi:hypothetical protein
MKTSIGKMCSHSAPDCPEIFLDETIDPPKQISITDDFGHTIEMSKEQFRGFVEKARNGEMNRV